MKDIYDHVTVDLVDEVALTKLHSYVQDIENAVEEFGADEIVRYLKLRTVGKLDRAIDGILRKVSKS